MTQSRLDALLGQEWRGSSRRSTACIGKGTANTLQAFPFASASSLGDWWLPGFVSDGRTSEAVSWWPEVNPTHPTSSNIWREGSLVPVNSPNDTQSGWLSVFWDGQKQQKYDMEKKKKWIPLPIRIPSKMTLRGSVAKKTELFSFLQAPVMFALVLPRISCGREDMFYFQCWLVIPSHFTFHLSPSPASTPCQTECLPGNQSCLPKCVHSLWEGCFHTAQMTHIPQKMLSLLSWMTVVTAVWFRGKGQKAYLCAVGLWFKKHVHVYSQLIFTSTMWDRLNVFYWEYWYMTLRKSVVSH